MKILPLGRASSLESIDDREQKSTIEPPSNEGLIQYAETYVLAYRSVIDRFFVAMAEHLPFYQSYPYKTTLIRTGAYGVMCLRKPAEVGGVEVRSWGDWPGTLTTIFEIQDYFESPFGGFDFTPRTYHSTDAEIDGTRAALKDAVALYWHLIDQDEFAAICRDLIEAEGVGLVAETSDSFEVDAAGVLIIGEIAGFRREERWAFQFHHQPHPRVSTQVIREAEKLVEESEFDVLCLVTSGDLTSIGNYVAVGSTRVRVWDRSVLYHLMNRHLDVVQQHFNGYAEAIALLDEEFKNRGGVKYEGAKTRLQNCESGQKHYQQYEQVGIEILSDIFIHTLGPPRIQTSTQDRIHRRDVVFRNLQGSQFFRRIAARFDADFLIVDFKNYDRALTGPTLESAAKYANKALGKVILIVARKGAGKTSRSAQVRIFRDQDVVVLPISDEQLLEMVARKERGEQAEDVLEDLLDELLISF